MRFQWLNSCLRWTSAMLLACPSLASRDSMGGSIALPLPPLPCLDPLPFLDFLVLGESLRFLPALLPLLPLPRPRLLDLLRLLLRLRLFSESLLSSLLPLGELVSSLPWLESLLSASSRSSVRMSSGSISSRSPRTWHACSLQA